MKKKKPSKEECEKFAKDINEMTENFMKKVIKRAVEMATDEELRKQTELELNGVRDKCLTETTKKGAEKNTAS